MDSDGGLVSWLGAATTPALTKDQTIHYYHTSSPRTVFLKSVPSEGAGIDLGAGDGGTRKIRDWLHPPRPDIRLFAVSLEQNQGLAEYEERWIGDFEQNVPRFSRDTFDFILCCHFVEHIKDLWRFFGWVSSTLSPGGRIYIEWPHPDAKLQPRREDLFKLGYRPVITNFYDDATHVDAWNQEQLAEIAKSLGLRLTAWSQIKSPWVGDQMRNVALRGGGDDVDLTFAIWAHVGWAQYAIFEKPAQ